MAIGQKPANLKSRMKEEDEMITTLLYDTQGTLVDNYSIASVIEPYVFESNTANHIAADWRFQQKWAMFYTTLSDNLVPFPELNKAALYWALKKQNVELPKATVEYIASQYHKLKAYPEVLGALKSLKGQNLTQKIVANPTVDMIRDHSDFAGTLPFIDEIISNSEEAKAYKPSPKVFELGIARAGCAKDEILWVTGHFWEITGAVRAGLKTAWINRARQPKMEIGIEPTYHVKNLQELSDALAKQ
jgi:2-haloacid dehalogenase